MTRLIELLNRPFTAEDSSWLISSSGLLAACREIVARDDVATLDMLESSGIWSRLTGVSPHPLGPSLVRRGQLIVAAARLACPSSGNGRPDDDTLDALAGSILVDSAEATPERAIAQHLVADLVEWFSSGTTVSGGIATGDLPGRRAFARTSSAPDPRAVPGGRVIRARHRGEPVHDCRHGLRRSSRQRPQQPVVTGSKGFDGR